MCSDSLQRIIYYLFFPNVIKLFGKPEEPIGVFPYLLVHY